MTSATNPPPRHLPMSATATLTNCYAPLPAAPGAAPPPRRARSERAGGDGAGGGPPARGSRGLRHVRLERGVLSQSSGSALVEWGHTKVLVSVRGPRPARCSGVHAADHGGGLACEGEQSDPDVVLMLGAFGTFVSLMQCQFTTCK